MDDSDNPYAAPLPTPPAPPTPEESAQAQFRRDVAVLLGMIAAVVIMGAIVEWLPL